MRHFIVANTLVITLKSAHGDLAQILKSYLDECSVVSDREFKFSRVERSSINAIN